jgi:hypothetical protein
MNPSTEVWFWKYIQWFDYLVGLVGADLIFLLSLVAVAIGVQLSCHGSKRAKPLLTGAGLVLTGTVALGQGSTVVGMVLIGYAVGPGAFHPWWRMTAWLALAAWAAFAAQIVQHVQLLRRLRRRTCAS